jgi:hypothetical protein
MTGDRAKPPRFPYVAALLCAVCVGVAAWAWMRYSYAWNVTPRTLIDACDLGEGGSWKGVYVSVHGQIVSLIFGSASPPVPPTAYVDVAQERTKAEVDARLREFQAELRANVSEEEYREFERMYGPEGFLVSAAWPDMDYQLPVRVTSEEWGSRSGGLLLKGRVVEHPRGLAVDTTASRFHPASITGLVIGAMGVFVFGLALRHWLNERRGFREEASGRNTSVERPPSAG